MPYENLFREYRRKNLLILLDSILGFLSGILMAGILFVIFWLFNTFTNFTASPLIKLIFATVIISIIEESSKYVPLKYFFKSHYLSIGLLLGLGFGLLEYFTFIYPVAHDYLAYLSRLPALAIHILTGGVMGFAVSKRKSWLGLVLAIMLHCLFNFYIEFK